MYNVDPLERKDISMFLINLYPVWFIFSNYVQIHNPKTAHKSVSLLIVLASVSHHFRQTYIHLNGSELAKLKKSIPDMSLP